MTSSSIRSPLRIAIAQFDPKLGQLQRNMQRIDELLATMPRGSTDLLVLPEMALTGYVFRTPDSIRPYLEAKGVGATTQYAKDLAERFGCTVVAGYPELPASNEVTEGPQVGANAAVICAPNGDVLYHYRKTNMFDTDLPWCIPGTGFGAFDWNGLRVAIGICMDLNPDRNAIGWTMEDGPFELADYVIKENAQVLILLCAWLDSKDGGPDGRPDPNTVRFWVARLDPLWRPERGDRIFIVANRCGTEDGELFAGSSMVLRYNSKTDELVRVGGLGRTEEAILRRTVEV